MNYYTPMICQKEIQLKEFARGFHIITNIIVDAIEEMDLSGCGICSIFIKHTSASLTVNENADPTVRNDFETHFNVIAPESANYYTHTSEGSDDMPAHLKAAMLGSSVTIPITKGKLNLGTWQGVYLCEHRNNGGRRKILITVMT